MIDGVQILPLSKVPTEGGPVLHMLRADAPHFSSFGEIYFSVANPGTVKAWKRHRRMTQQLAVPVGRVRVVVYDDREASPTKGELQVIDMGEHNYVLLRIPPLLWYGFQGIARQPSLIANCTDMPHDPYEAEACEPGAGGIPYTWAQP